MQETFDIDNTPAGLDHTATGLPISGESCHVTMRIKVDKKACVGNARCNAVASVVSEASDVTPRL
jgi:hypothetical protein